MAKNIKRSLITTVRIHNLLELDENTDSMPINNIPSVFDRDNNEDIISTELNIEVEDEEFELDSNLDIMPRE